MSIDPQHFWRLGLLGYPLGHSLSPVLHQAALSAAGLVGEYRLYPIPSTSEGENEIAEMIRRLRTGELDGLNVTIPHKQLVMKHVDRLTSTARAVGAANTLVRDASGLLVGHNTDVPGFWRDVNKILGQRAGRALVLGAGGSARAVVYSLLQAGWRVVVIARRLEQSLELVRHFRGLSGSDELLGLSSFDPGSLLENSHDCALLVNTTPLGMHPKPEACPWPKKIPLPLGAAVYDLVYNPLETCLVKAAREQGLPSSNGSGMLAAQAALAFSIWTGFEPPFDIMDRAFPGYLSG